MLLTALLALPLLIFYPIKMGSYSFLALCIVILISSIAPSILYLVAQSVSSTHWKKRIPAMPVLMAVGVGIAYNNTLAVLSALSGNKGTFIRTPKAGQTVVKKYKNKIPWGSVVELGLGLYCVLGLLVYMENKKYLVGPFLGLYSIGFICVGILSILHHFKAPTPKVAPNNQI